MKRAAPLVCAAVFFSAGCKPTSVNEAEAKADIGYLAANGSPEAVAALGRLADKSDKARAAIEGRAEVDVNAYIAAWSAVQRGASWGNQLIRASLADPARAELAASAMTRGDAKLNDYTQDFSNALAAAGREPRVTIAAMLASSNAAPLVDARIKDKATRANMCRGLASPEASATSRKVFMSAHEDARDDPACVDAAVRLATYDDATMAWLASAAEPGMLSGAGKSETMPCDRLARTWTEVFNTRPSASYTALAVPLAHAIKRCAAALDPVLEVALAKPGTLPLVVGGVDPYGPETRELTKTCTALRGAVLRGATGRTRDRAADTLAHGCKAARK